MSSSHVLIYISTVTKDSTVCLTKPKIPMTPVQQPVQRWAEPSQVVTTNLTKAILTKLRLLVESQRKEAMDLARWAAWINSRRNHRSLQMAPTKRRMAPTKRTMAPTKQTMAPAKRRMAPTKGRTAPTKGRMAPTMRRMAPTTRRMRLTLAKEPQPMLVEASKMPQTTFNNNSRVKIPTAT